ncbi:MAG: lysophospholipid acyltransferase family protein [Bacteroidetes bacterium]|nr:lysophospholipid acyltransferase family protein [Bacteroidota bacterium]
MSLLPLWLLYGLSDFSFVILFYGMGYRKEVVRSNLSHAFPEKTAVEIEQIMRRFYRSFCDQWIETMKLMTMSKRSLNRRMKGNWELLDALYAEGKNVYLLTGHTFNWEWANVTVAFNTRLRYACVYLPLSSTSFDKLMLHIRTRLGARMISMKGLLSGFKQLAGSQYILGLAADQNPSVVEVADWLPFMHREAPFFRGPEQMPRRAKAAVVLIGIRKLRRGYYEASLEKLCDDASQMSEGGILKGYVNFIEQQLGKQPENWLWSHRRWKHVRKSAPTK